MRFSVKTSGTLFSNHPRFRGPPPVFVGPCSGPSTIRRPAPPYDVRRATSREILTPVDVVSIPSDDVAIGLSRAEVLALRNILQYAPWIPLEVRGPGAIFERLVAQFEDLANAMANE